jgi:hypothetical protein
MSTLSSLGVPEYDIYDEVFGYAKIYPNATKLFLFDKSLKIRKAGFEAQKKKPYERKTSNSDPMVILDSLRRTKTRLSDLVTSNNFDLFCTFTFAEDRQNVDRLKHRMAGWLDHQNQRVGKFDYVVVPEFHSDGKSIHFHALFKGYQGELIDSGHKRKDGRIVYNIANYHFGFSTATKIDAEGVPLVASYIKKYISKDMPQFNNKKRYWCSQGLERPRKVRNPLMFPYQMAKDWREHRMQNATLKIADEKVDFVSRDDRPKDGII